MKLSPFTNCPALMRQSVKFWAGPARSGAQSRERINLLSYERVPHRTKSTPRRWRTTFYKGNSYDLIIVTSLNGIMRGKEYIHGYIHAPVMSFEANIIDFILN